MDYLYEQTMQHLGYDQLVCDIFIDWENVKDEILISERKTGSGNGTIHVFLGAADKDLRKEFTQYYSAVENGEDPSIHAVNIKHFFLKSNVISMLGYICQYCYEHNENVNDQIKSVLPYLATTKTENGLMTTHSLFKLSTGSNKLRPYFKQFDSDGVFTKVIRRILLPNSSYKISLFKNRNNEYAAFWLIGFDNLTNFEADSSKIHFSSNRINAQQFDVRSIVKAILSTGLIYSPSLIKRLAYSLMAKPFVILSGLAGSGKTQLALAFAKCLSENENNKFDKQICSVSIGADWTNREPLLGYPNALNKDEYVKPESGVLQLLMRANEDRDKPYFLILDEMNLSVVERYFADFLSAMESGEPIKLWDGNESEEDENKFVPKEIHLPKNVFIIGTINVDETTYMFSPKVLDRANVIEFKIAADEMEDYLGKKVNINLESAYSACADMAIDFVNKANSQVEKDEKNKDVLLSFFKKLKEVNAEFGYRTVNEISRYLHFSDGELTADSAIDTAILQKLLPKLHGSRKKLVPVLSSLWKLCLNDGVAKEIDAEFKATEFKYPESAEKIQRMYHAVVDNGFTSFAEA